MKVPYPMEMIIKSLRYTAIAHVWNNGDIEYVNVLDNAAVRNTDLEGERVPEWLAERVALLRLCEINRDQKGEGIGRKFTDNMLYVYLNHDEYTELMNKSMECKSEKTFKR